MKLILNLNEIYFFVLCGLIKWNKIGMNFVDCFMLFGIIY